MMDARDYLRRLELAEVPSLDAEGLGLLHERHMVTVPFENHHVVAGEAGALDTGRVLERIVRARRGGICYELNAAFHWLLAQIGFEVRMLEARVADDVGGFGPPFDHMALAVRLPAGERLVDVGFGEGFVRPLDLAARDDIRERAQTFRIREEDEDLVLERRDRRALGFVPMYRILPGERRLADFEPGWRHHTTSPDSPFTRAPFCTIATPDGRVTLHGDELTIARNGREERLSIGDETVRAAMLRRYFRIG